jgi:hypothetical protein
MLEFPLYRLCRRNKNIKNLSDTNTNSFVFQGRTTVYAEVKFSYNSDRRE